MRPPCLHRVQAIAQGCQLHDAYQRQIGRQALLAAVEDQKRHDRPKADIHRQQQHENGAHPGHSRQRPGIPEGIHQHQHQAGDQHRQAQMASGRDETGAQGLPPPAVAPGKFLAAGAGASGPDANPDANPIASTSSRPGTSRSSCTSTHAGTGIIAGGRNPRHHATGAPGWLPAGIVTHETGRLR